jgi:hypothetical protein
MESHCVSAIFGPDAAVVLAGRIPHRIDRPASAQVPKHPFKMHKRFPPPLTFGKASNAKVPVKIESAEAVGMAGASMQ